MYATPRTGRSEPGFAAGEHHALVLSGGGAKGSYEIGVMKALFEGASAATDFRPLSPSIYTGTSVGSFNAAYMASQSLTGDDRQVLAALERVWLQEIAMRPGGCGNGVFRLRGSPLELVTPSCWSDPLSQLGQLAHDTGLFTRLLGAEAARFVRSDEWLPNRVLQTADLNAFFDMTPLRHLLHRSIDLEGLRRSPKQLIVVASDFRHGTPRPFLKRAIQDRYGIEAVMASTAIPGIFPPTVIDGVPCVDGGVTMNTPLAPAFVAGGKVLHLIFSDPSVLDQPFPKPASTFETMYRLASIQMASNIHNNILSVPSLFDQMKGLRQLHQRGDIDGVTEGLKQLGKTDSPRRLSATESWPFGELEIHKFTPQTPLGGAEGLLDFRLENVTKNIELGYREATEHDCEVAGCIRLQPATSSCSEAAGG